MLVLLIPAAIILGIFFFKYNFSERSFRLGILKSISSIALFCLLFIELVSTINSINTLTTVLFWTILIAFFGYFGVIQKRNDFGKLKKNDFYHWAALSKLEQLIILFVSLSVVYIFILCITIPPNNLDSHNYHLNRIINWLQNNNVSHFPTVFAPELYHNAMAEYLVFQTFLLSQSDRFAALVQFTAMIGNLTAISLIAKELELSRKTQILAVFVVFIMTIGLLESSSTQVDYVACFFFVFFVLQFLKYKRSNSTSDLFWMSLAFGLGAFSKYTIFMYAFPFYVDMGIRFVISKKMNEIFKISIATIATLGVIYGFFWFRNYELFGNILSPSNGSRMYMERIPNEEFSLKVFISIFTRNIFIHAGLPFQGFNNTVDHFIYALHQFLKIDINDTRFAFNQYNTRFSIQEDMAPNTFHFYFGIIAFIFFKFRKAKNKRLNVITFLAFMGVALCSFILKFELWVSRTQMPFFSILSIYIAFFLSQIKPAIRNTIVLFTSIFAGLVLITNPNKPLVNLKYEAKKIQSYAPNELIPDRTEATQFDSTAITRWYSKANKVYQLKPNIDYKENKSEIFKSLIKSHYYDAEKDNNILNKTRAELYFAPNYYEYQVVKDLFEDDLPKIKNIGVVYYGGYGFYRYWAYLNFIKRIPVQMQHILFSKELKELKNANKTFEYNYILTDHIGMLKSFVNPSNFENIKKSGKFYLIKLKNQDTRQYYY